MSDASGHGKPWFDRLAHDLRGPLTSLQTAAYLLRTDPSGANAKELADLVVRQSQRMGRMIEELDDWSRAEQRRLVDAREQVDLESAIDMGLAAVSGCRLEPTYAPDARNLVVSGDSNRLPQLFRTLVEQAMARDADTARMAVSRVDGHAVVAVSDRGPALDDAARARLLQAPQIPPPDQGLGLRLLIAKAIVEAHGGRLEVDPAPDTSLCLRCTLPLA